MTLSGTIKETGLVLGCAVFVAGGLVAFVAADKATWVVSMKKGPLDENTVAPAQQFGNALAMVRQFDLPKPEGVLVGEVNNGSPAGKAGIKEGDVIVRYADHAVNTPHDLSNLVANSVPGAHVRIDVVRQGKPQTLTATVGTEGPASVASSPAEEGAKLLANLGLSVEGLTTDLGRQLGVPTLQGVVINGVAEGSPASLAGLQKGDLIVQADRQPVPNVRTFHKVIAKARHKDEVLLRITRQGANWYAILQMK